MVGFVALRPQDHRVGQPLRRPPSPGHGSAPARSLSPSPSPSRAPVAVRYTFDSGLGSLHSRQAEGGELAMVPHDGGLAVRFPQKCAHYGAPSCPRAILQSGPVGFLNPGRGAFTYGASVLIGPDETSKGANVVQKGFSVGGSQFKLQVDGEAGRPSCVIVGTASATIFVALASRSVADGRWHRLACTRGNALLTVALDGVEVGRTAIPSSLSIVNDDPLCIGGKGTSANNDQFVGVIDDVYVTRFA
ncbi:LamG domain-containing protein [Dactylosporangium sp. NPDC051485]|uniref:LamG domain-containing protein n=1 Tax=Dactylosporangium sp. NPDC051485 TaxID=3154846 RepID=UPI00342BC64F